MVDKLMCFSQDKALLDKQDAIKLHEISHWLKYFQNWL